MLTQKEKAKYQNITTSVLVKTGEGRLKGLVVASTTSGTLKFWDNTSAATTVLINTITPAAGAIYDFQDVGFNTGLYVTVANTIDCTVFYN